MKIDTTGLKSFIDNQKIEQLLSAAKKTEAAEVKAVLAKALLKKGLSLEEVAILIQNEDEDLIEEMYKTCHRIKQEIYGNRIVLFAPLYVGNECINDCVYCGFRISNQECFRKTLSQDELINETKALENNGHKRLIMVYGEHPMYDAKYIAETVKTVYQVKEKNGEIRRVNINAAPLDVEGYKIVKDAGIGTYQIFQETYHQPTYQVLHPRGPKSNFLWRLYGLDRAMQAGIDDLGIGALMGLYDWRFEVMGLMMHAQHLEETFGVGPHTISFPRIEEACGSDFTKAPLHEVSDADFKKLVAILRLAVPYTGLILTAREDVELRNEVLDLGVSQIDGGSSIGIGEYSHHDEDEYKKSQFILGDNRSLDEVILELSRHGYIPSFCTACYRLGRTGEHFMELSKPGYIKTFCQPNALLTFSEYLLDYGSASTRQAGAELIAKEIKDFPESERKTELLAKIEQLNSGKRDLYF
ncbi:MAG: [FeFe] hydrogenase H-cluster radical SAM maturase HydG [Candidatus Cloacimonadales bacterium]